MSRRDRKPLGKVGKAADNANAFISDVRGFGLDFSLVSTDPLTLRVEIADRVATKAEKQSVLDLLLNLLKLLK